MGGCSITLGPLVVHLLQLVLAQEPSPLQWREEVDPVRPDTFNTAWLLIHNTTAPPVHKRITRVRREYSDAVTWFQPRIGVSHDL